MRKWWIGGLAAVALMMSSCDRMAGELREGLHLEGVERMTAHGSSGMTLEMKVTNDSRRRLTVKRAKLTLFIDRRTVGHIYLHEPFRFERHSSGRVSSLWRMSFPDNMQLYALKRRILRDDTSQIFVSYDAVVRCGLVKANISGSYVSLSEFLNTFGMDTEILKQYLEW